MCVLVSLLERPGELVTRDELRQKVWQSDTFVDFDAGLNKANPIAQILSGMLMLHHIGEHEAGVRLERAIADLIREGKSVTYDMKPNRDDPTAVGTSEVADALIAKLEA